MDESLSSLSDVRIASLITTSITDMVRQEVGKIMQELNMPVCNEAIDRIIAENLDKEVEKQNFVKTYKRKLNKINQYKCIEKRAESDEVVISSLQLIENRVKKLEDFVLQNLMQSPKLMQDLAVRSRENLNVPEKQQEQQTLIGTTEPKNKNSDELIVEKSNSNSNEKDATEKPTLLNLDDVIKVIKECPETQDSFDIFQSAAERIKHDLERFIQDYKRDLHKTPRERGESGELKPKDVALDRGPEVKHIKPDEEVLRNASTETKAPGTSENTLVPTQFVTNMSTSLGCAKLTTNTVEDIKINFVTPPAVAVQTAAEQEIVRPTVEAITKSPMEADTVSPTKPTPQTEKATTEVKLAPVGEAAFGGNVQHYLATSMSCGDKQIMNPKDPRLIATMLPPTQPRGEKVDKEHKLCKQCQRDRPRPCAIDDDIKWKLDRILDHIGDFCSRSRCGRECGSYELDRRSLPANAFQQPGTSADLSKRKLTRSNSGKPPNQPKQLQHVVIQSTALNGNLDRQNLDRIMEHIRQMGQHHHLQQRQEVIVTNIKSKPTTQPTNLPTNAQQQQPVKLQANKTVNQPRKSVEAFKTKWSIEYTKNTAGSKAAAAVAQHAADQNKIHMPKSSIQTRSTLEAIPKSTLKKRLPPTTISISHQQQQQQQQQQPVNPKSSTTLMLESIDQLARTAATTKARMARAGYSPEEIGWVYSRRPQPSQTMNLGTEVRRTKVLYHNYKL